MKKLILIMMLLVPCVFLGCDYEADLPNGYMLVRTNAYTVCICPRGIWQSAPVPPRIVELKVIGDHVVGRTVLAPDADDVGTPSQAGYFILDTKSGKAAIGLEKDEWNERLRQTGIGANPHLVSPRWFSSK